MIDPEDKEARRALELLASWRDAGGAPPLAVASMVPVLEQLRSYGLVRRKKWGWYAIRGSGLVWLKCPWRLATRREEAEERRERVMRSLREGNYSPVKLAEELGVSRRRIRQISSAIRKGEASNG